MAVLIKTNFNFADQFDCKEFAIMSDEEYEKWIAAWERKFKDGTVQVQFGSDEAIQIDDFDDFECGLEITEISDVERKMFEKYFDGSWGTGNIFDFDDFDDEFYDDDDETFEFPDLEHDDEQEY